MSFLNGMFLLALPLAAVPVILHFYRQRQREVVAWGAMQFLQNAVRKGRRRERLEEILLMLMRCAAVFALVFALARPQLNGRWFGGGGSREVILVLDNSMSTSRQVADETAFDVIQKQARELIDQLTDDDVVQVLLAVGGPDWLTTEALPAAERPALLKQLKTLSPSEGSADLLSSIQAAVDTSATEDAQSRHIVVFTDGQTHGWQPDEQLSWQQIHRSSESSAVPTSVQVVVCGDTETPIANIAVTDVEASATKVRVGQTITVNTQIQNMGTGNSGELTLEHQVDDESLANSTIAELDSGVSTVVSWTWSAQEPGVYTICSRLDAKDQLEADDQNTVVVEVVERIPVLIVKAAPEFRQRISEAELLTSALGYDDTTPRVGWSSVFAPTVIDAKEFNDANLADYHVVVITSLTPLHSGTVERLRRFVEQGGGLWVMLGRRTDRETFNSVWFDDGGGLSPLPLGEWVANESSKMEEAIHPPEPDHPTTKHLSDTNRLDIDKVRIQSRQSFDRRNADDQLSVLLETGDGEPLAIEQYVGRGRVIIQAIPCEVSRSNLPLSKAWVVMVHDWMEYLAQPAATQFNPPAGSRINLPASMAGTGAGATIITPNGTEKSLTLRESDGMSRYQYSQTHLPGRYDIRSTDADSNSIPFYVSRNPRESDLTSLTSEQQESLVNAAGISSIQASLSSLPEAIDGGGGERPIWTSLLIALLILLTVELLMSTRTTRLRSPETFMDTFENPTGAPATESVGDR